MKRFVITAALVLFAIDIASAQTAPKKNQQKPAQAKVVEVATQAPAELPQAPPPPFSPVFFNSSESILSYLPNDPQKVYAWIESQVSSVPGKPDQYSNAEERQKYEATLAEKMKAIQPIPIIGNCQKKYDADRQSFEVKALLSSIKDYSLKSPNPEALRLRRLTLAQANLQRDTYSAQNAYGANIEVSREISDNYVFAYPAGTSYEPTSALVQGNSSSSVRLPYRYLFNFMVLSAKMPPSEARENDKHIACMYVISLEQPYTFKFNERESPTRDMPFDITTNGFAIFGRLDQISVVNKSTGQIYDQAIRPK